MASPVGIQIEILLEVATQELAGWPNKGTPTRSVAWGLGSLKKEEKEKQRSSVEFLSLIFKRIQSLQMCNSNGHPLGEDSFPTPLSALHSSKDLKDLTPEGAKAKS